ncbi:RTA1 like protein [Penicillium camemberti]|uniref:RTA1 like protein n=1 Tax=Penicillium camemberti (strain FM 013) TaxID=1429867 RepID=A0A0G4P9C6_PENC3|nr:RTA1 like protein [Penicillium camemberti]
MVEIQGNTSPIFVFNDIASFFTQLVGAGVQVAGNANLVNTGRKVIIFGLGFALVEFFLFMWIAIDFHYRMNRDPTPITLYNQQLNWKRYMLVIHLSCLALMVRKLIKLIEFGVLGSALTKEVFVYLRCKVLDFVVLYQCFWVVSLKFLLDGRYQTCAQELAQKIASIAHILSFADILTAP